MLDLEKRKSPAVSKVKNRPPRRRYALTLARHVDQIAAGRRPISLRTAPG
jgi:hypothetical protein